VEIGLLGRFAVRVDGRDVPRERFGGRLTRTLIALLAARRGVVVPKDVLTEALWGDAAPRDPSASLDVLASRARRALHDQAAIRAVSGGLVLTDEDSVEVDAERFASAVQRGRTYLAAGQAGPALAAFEEAFAAWAEPLPEETYRDWAEPFRSELGRLRLESLEGGATAALDLGNVPVASRLASAAVDAEPLREAATLLLVTALAMGGDQVGALGAFDRFRVRLRDEVGLDPSTEAFELQAKVLHGVRNPAAGLLGELVRTAEPLDPRTALAGRGSGPMRARTLASLALLAAGSDDYGRAAELVEQALIDAREDDRALAEALYAGSIVDMNLGEAARASARANEAMTLFERLGDDEGAANILDGKAMAAFLEGRVAEGVAAFQRVAELFTASGTLARVITPRSTRGHGLVLMGRPDEGLADAEAALALAVDLGERESEAYASWHLAEALAALGRSTEAIASADRALAIAEELRHREWHAAALRALGIAHRSAGALDLAEEAHRRGVQASEGMPLFLTWHAAGLARTLLAAGYLEDAGRWSEEAAGDGGPPLGRFEARLAVALVARVSGDERADRLAADLRRDAEAVGYTAIVAELDAGA
jgi:DNA-binding SARP family transcriptional activator